MALNPADAEQVGDALLAYLSEHREVSDMVFLRPPVAIGRGMDTHIYSFQLNAEGLGPTWSAPLVLRLYTTAGQAAKAQKEAAVQRFAAEQGYPAVAPLLIDPNARGFELPVMLMPRVAGTPMLEHITSRPLRVASFLRRMAQLQALLHSLPVAGCELPAEPPLVERKLAELRAGHTGDGEQEEALSWLEANKARVMDEDAVLCHGDFYPLNILIEDDGSAHVLDWSDAELGDRHSDVARSSLMVWTAIFAESATQRIMLRLARGYLQWQYLRAYRARAPLDGHRLAYWKALHAFAGWQLVERLLDPQGDLAEVAKKDAAARLPKELGARLRTLFWKLTRSV